MGRLNAGVYELKKPVFFVGFMGAGKTSVSRRLARTCRLVSVDMDSFIERQEGKKISDIFKIQGENAFRDLESALLTDLSLGDPKLISCGGGVVLRSENRQTLKDEGYVVYLEVEADEAASRISNIATRPLFKDIQNARKIIEERIPLYEDVVDLHIDTKGKSVSYIANEVQSGLQKAGILWKKQK